MKRFWTATEVVGGDDGWTIALDGRPVRTPARVPLLLPFERLAREIASEWAAQTDTIDPRTMPLTGLANAAIDRVAPDPERFAAELARYAEADLLCYRSEDPAILAQRQADAWDPLLDWARQRFDIAFVIATGVIHLPQPAATVARLGAAVVALDPWRLAALSPLVTLSGSLVAALAVVEGAREASDVWHAVSVDERWQRERWGSDAEAEAALAARSADFAAAARFVSLLG